MPPSNPEKFTNDLDLELQNLNSYYYDLISGNVLRKLEIVSLNKSSFIKYMKSLGKLGGQNKVPRLSNDRKLADQLIQYRV